MSSSESDSPSQKQQAADDQGAVTTSTSSPNSAANPSSPASKEDPRDIASRLEVVGVEKRHYETSQPEVWRMRDPVTGKEYYAKTATPIEAEMTQRAANLQLPPESPLIAAGVLVTGRDNAPKALQGQLTGNSNDGRTSFLITEAVPKGTRLGELCGINGPIPDQWKSQPITADEYRQLLESFKVMNEQGVFHHDISSNTEIVRENGKLKVYVYDFDHVALPASSSKAHEDLAQLVMDFQKDMIASGALSPEAIEVGKQYEKVIRDKLAQSPEMAGPFAAKKGLLATESEKSTSRGQPEIPSSLAQPRQGSGETTEPRPGAATEVEKYARHLGVSEDDIVARIVEKEGGTLIALHPDTDPAQWIRENPNSPLVQEALREAYKVDLRTGYGNEFAMNDAVQKAIASGDQHSYISIDGNNFGGMAKAVGDEKAPAHSKAMVEIVRRTLEAEGLSLEVFRHTAESLGDEYAMVVKGDPEKIAAALEKADAAVRQYAKENGLSDIPHRKGGEREKGVSLAFASESITPDKTPEQIYDAAQKRLEASKTQSVPPMGELPGKPSVPPPEPSVVPEPTPNSHPSAKAVPDLASVPDQPKQSAIPPYLKLEGQTQLPDGTTSVQGITIEGSKPPIASEQGHRGHWKIHLNVPENMDDPSTRALFDWAVANRDKIEQAKIGKSSGQSGKGMTIYAGSYEDMVRIVAELEKMEAEGKIKLRQPGANAARDDMPVGKSGKIMTRFDAVGGDAFNRYGKSGIPYHESTLTMPTGDPLNPTERINPREVERRGSEHVRESLKKAYLELEKQYGSLFTGKPAGERPDWAQWLFEKNGKPPVVAVDPSPPETFRMGALATEWGMVEHNPAANAPGQSSPKTPGTPVGESRAAETKPAAETPESLPVPTSAKAEEQLRAIDEARQRIQKNASLSSQEKAELYNTLGKMESNIHDMMDGKPPSKPVSANETRKLLSAVEESSVFSGAEQSPQTQKLQSTLNEIQKETLSRRTQQTPSAPEPPKPTNVPEQRGKKSAVPPSSLGLVPESPPAVKPMPQPAPPAAEQPKPAAPPAAPETVPQTPPKTESTPDAPKPAVQDADAAARERAASNAMRIMGAYHSVNALADPNADTTSKAMAGVTGAATVGELAANLLGKARAEAAFGVVNKAMAPGFSGLTAYEYYQEGDRPVGAAINAANFAADVATLMPKIPGPIANVASRAALPLAAVAAAYELGKNGAELLETHADTIDKRRENEQAFESQRRPGLNHAGLRHFQETYFTDGNPPQPKGSPLDIPSDQIVQKNLGRAVELVRQTTGKAVDLSDVPSADAAIAAGIAEKEKQRTGLLAELQGEMGAVKTGTLGRVAGFLGLGVAGSALTSAYGKPLVDNPSDLMDYNKRQELRARLNAAGEFGGEQLNIDATQREALIRKLDKLDELDSQIGQMQAGRQELGHVRDGRMMQSHSFKARKEQVDAMKDAYRKEAAEKLPQLRNDVAALSDAMVEQDKTFEKLAARMQSEGTRPLPEMERYEQAKQALAKAEETLKNAPEQDKAAREYEMLQAKAQMLSAQAGAREAVVQQYVVQIDAAEKGNVKLMQSNLEIAGNLKDAPPMDDAGKQLQQGYQKAAAELARVEQEKVGDTPAEKLAHAQKLLEARKNMLVAETASLKHTQEAFQAQFVKENGIEHPSVRAGKGGKYTPSETDAYRAKNADTPTMKAFEASINQSLTMKNPDYSSEDRESIINMRLRAALNRAAQDPTLTIEQAMQQVADKERAAAVEKSRESKAATPQAANGNGMAQAQNDALPSDENPVRLKVKQHTATPIASVGKAEAVVAGTVKTGEEQAPVKFVVAEASLNNNLSGGTASAGKGENKGLAV